MLCACIVTHSCQYAHHARLVPYNISSPLCMLHFLSHFIFSIFSSKTPIHKQAHRRAHTAQIAGSAAAARNQYKQEENNEHSFSVLCLPVSACSDFCCASFACSTMAKPYSYDIIFKCGVVRRYRENTENVFRASFLVAIMLAGKDSDLLWKLTIDIPCSMKQACNGYIIFLLADEDRNERGCSFLLQKNVEMSGCRRDELAVVFFIELLSSFCQL